MNLFTRRKVLQRLMVMLPTFSVLNLDASTQKSEHKKYKSLEELLRDHPRDRVHSHRGVIRDAGLEQRRLLNLGLLESLSAHGSFVEFGLEDPNHSSALRSALGGRYRLINPLLLSETQSLIYETMEADSSVSSQDVEWVWNHVCSWQGSPRTRLAVLAWAQKNLKVGGLYIDEKLEKIPSNADYSGLQVLFKDNFFTVFKKRIES